VKLSHLSQPILVRLMELDQQAASLAEQADAAEQQVEHARAILNGKIEDPKVDVRKVQATFETLLKQAQARRHRCNTEQRILSNVKLWLERQPSDVALEPVKVRLNGQDLASVRKRLQQIADEVSRIKAAPTPSADIRQRTEAYVAQLARHGEPIVRGVGEGSTLEVWWPLHASANRMNMMDFDKGTGNPLYLAALLQPQALVERILGVIDETASKPMPVSERAPRLAELQQEVDELRRLEEVLVQRGIDNGEDVTRDPSSPSWAILGVRGIGVRGKRTTGATA
jgi:hypothetical protein